MKKPTELKTYTIGPKIIHLSETSEYSTLEILKVGSFDSRTHGKFTITKQMLREAKKNFENNVHRIADHDNKPMAMLNFDHEQKEAAGWIKALELNDNETILLAKLEFTPIGSEKITNKEYLFASAEFSPEFYDPELKQTFKNVLTGVALTNKPFIKGMKSIELTELREFNMEEILKLINDLTQEEIVILMEKLRSMLKSNDNPEDGKPPMEAVSDDKDKRVNFSENEIALSEKIKKLEAEKVEGVKALEFSELLAIGKVIPAQKEAYLKGDVKTLVQNSSTQEINFSQKSTSL